MRINHCIKMSEYDTWKEWVKTHIGEKDEDYSIIIEREEHFNDDGVLIYAGSKQFWEIPDPKKAMLFLLRFS